MKSQIVRRISEKYLIPILPGFKVKGSLLYQKDIQYLLKGYSFESSAFSRNSFTIEVFVQPLYIPSPYLVFNFGNRLGVIAKQKDTWWEYDKAREEELMDEILSMISSFGVPFLERRNQLDKFLSIYGKIGITDNPNMVEGLCYTYVLIEDYPKARIMLSSFNRILMKEIEKRPKIEWIVDMKNRIHLILSFLENQNFSRAKEQLKVWRNYTVEKLGISDL